MAVKLQSKQIHKPSKSNDLFKSFHVYVLQNKYQNHVVPCVYHQKQYEMKLFNKPDEV